MGRRKGTGRLFQDKGGTWFVRWRINGREITRSCRTRDRNEAAAFAERESAIFTAKDDADRAALLQRRFDTAADRLERLTRTANELPVERMAAEFYSSPRRPNPGPSTLDLYLRAIDRFADFAAGRSFDDVDVALADRYAASLGRAVAAGTFNKHINALDLCWRVLGRSRGTGANPWTGIARKRKDAHVRRAITDDELAAVMDSTTGDLRALIAIAAYTGLRMGDAVRLRWESFRGDLVQVRTAKTGAVVSLPIHDRIAAALPRRKAAGLVIPRLAAKYERDPAAISKMIERAFAAAGIATSVEVDHGAHRTRPDCTCHSLRHYFVSKAIAAGIPAAIVRELVGHSSVDMTEHYTHVDPATLSAAFDKIR